LIISNLQNARKKQKDKVDDYQIVTSMNARVFTLRERLNERSSLARI
jgi:hypothetical protein